MHGLNIYDTDPRHLHGPRVLSRRRPSHCQSRPHVRTCPGHKPQREGKHPRPASHCPTNLLKVVRFSTRPPDRFGHSQHAITCSEDSAFMVLIVALDLSHSDPRPCGLHCLLNLILSMGRHLHLQLSIICYLLPGYLLSVICCLLCNCATNAH